MLSGTKDCDMRKNLKDILQRSETRILLWIQGISLIERRLTRFERERKLSRLQLVLPKDNTVGMGI